jgi:hypothetical protein
MDRHLGEIQPLSMQAPVLFPIVEIGPYSVADYEPKILVEGHIPRVEYTVDVAAQKNAVRNLM